MLLFVSFEKAVGIENIVNKYINAINDVSKSSDHVYCFCYVALIC